LIEPVNNYVPFREKMAEIMFEYFGVPNVYFAMQEAMTLISAGRVTGLVVNIGHGVTHTVPIVDYPLHVGRSETMRLDIAGKDITSFLFQLLEGRGYKFDTNSMVERFLVNKIKEDLCYVAPDIDEEIKKFNEDPQSFEKNFILPDGQEISIGKERFLSTEALFNPILVKKDGFELTALHEAIYKSIESSAIDSRKELYKNIVLGGGSSLFPNLDVRIQKELSNVKTTETKPGTKNVKVKVVAPFERDISAWIGASTYVTMPKYNISEFWVSTENYIELGKKSLNRFNQDSRNKDVQDDDD